MEFIFRSLRSNDLGSDAFYRHPDEGEKTAPGSSQQQPEVGGQDQSGPVPSSMVPFHHNEAGAEEPVRHQLETGILKVSAKSRPSAVAGAIAGLIRTTQRAEVQAIGAGATNQAIKAVAIAREYLVGDGYDIVAIPAFIDVMIGNEERTAIRLVVEPR